MKLLHTSDWHLGRQLFGRRRYGEFDLFLDWMLETVVAQKVDVLIVAGDIFDTTTPSNRAQEQYYRFLMQVRDAGCRHTVVVAGNHDSPTFLDAPASLLKSMRVHVVGAAPDDIADEVLLLDDVDGNLMAVVCAAPYLRDRDLRRAELDETEEDRNRKVLQGIQSHYAQLLQAVDEKVDDSENVPLIATGHLFTSGAKTVDGDGVRDLYVGALAHLNAAAFPPRFDYVALGHLHVPQKVGENEAIRYSGSPLPMGFGEANQQKQVVLVEWVGRKKNITPIPVPCFQRLAKIEGDMVAIEAAFEQLKSANESVWLEVAYTGDELAPDLKERVGAMAIPGQLEILRISNRRVFNQVLKSVEEQEDLSNLDVTEVFLRRLESDDIPLAQREALLHCYAEILQNMREADKRSE